MSTGKKGKKKKGKTVDLMAFLADGGAASTIPLKSSNWADEIEDEHAGYSTRNSKEPVILPTAPRAARGSGVDEENIPTNPPYVAYISNLPYDVDEDDLAEFFTDMKVSNMRLPKDSNKLRGYGYVEFEDRQSLIDALSISNATIKARHIRIEVSNSSSDDRRGGRMGRDNRRDNYDDVDRTSGDWRSGPREDVSGSNDTYKRGYGNSERREYREGGDYDNKPGAWREKQSDDRGRSAFRDRGGYKDDEKDREWSRYDRGSRDRDGRDGRDGREGRDGDRGSSFGPRRNYGDREGDRGGWDRERRDSRPPESKQEPRTRPKLQLQPRTKPVESIAVKEETAETSENTEKLENLEKTENVENAEKTENTENVEKTENIEKIEKTERTERMEKMEKIERPTPTPVPAVNIFGAAKPVDTTAREREIEERLTRSYADSKTKEEGDSESWGSREGTWGRRNGGEGRDDRDRDRDRDRNRPTWRSEEDRGRRIERSAPRNQQASSRQDQRDSSRGGQARSRGGNRSEDRRRQSGSRDRKDVDKEIDIDRMPKAKDEQPPNFVASNKYSMLPDDVNSDDMDD